MTRWTDPEFVREAHAWIGSHVDVTGEIEQPHVEWWSTVMRIPTGEGVVWFKATAEHHGFEVSLIDALARLRPAAVPELVAEDAERGWMITRDGGTRLRELISTRADLAHWEAFLPSYSDLQLAAMPHVDDLVSVGVPEERLGGIAERVDRVLDGTEFLMLGMPGGLTDEERALLRAKIPDIARMCADLAERGIPETIQHDDLNDGNVFMKDGRYRAFDWGDACISHPLHSLTVLLRAAAARLDLEPGGRDVLRLRDAYLEPFSLQGFGDDLSLIAALAYRTGTLARALAWHRYLEPLPPAEWGEDLESIPYGFRMFLADGPMGSWE